MRRAVLTSYVQFVTQLEELIGGEVEDEPERCVGLKALLIWSALTIGLA